MKSLPTPTGLLSFVTFTVFTIAGGNIFAATTESVSSTLEVEVHRMMDALGWPRMVNISLQRGDIQRRGRARFGIQSSDPLGQCFDEKYTPERVLERVSAGYQQVYSDPKVVSEITRYALEPGFRKILDKIANRSPAVGAKAAYEEHKISPLDSLTEDEKLEFSEFANSIAGKAYLGTREAQLKVHQAEFTMLADQIMKECK
ncbi:hypothetical protein ACFQUU_13545 [Herbaspirillum sp. GCM10030257]|uniref:hypothetical protein n=1 Tax=Herbaspirillum sp. GCM10030257 TaxID=3273393 RepID=UPI0036226733